MEVHEILNLSNNVADDRDYTYQIEVQFQHDAPYSRVNSVTGQPYKTHDNYESAKDELLSLKLRNMVSLQIILYHKGLREGVISRYFMSPLINPCVPLFYDLINVSLCYSGPLSLEVALELYGDLKPHVSTDLVICRYGWGYQLAQRESVFHQTAYLQLAHIANRSELRNEEIFLTLLIESAASLLGSEFCCLLQLQLEKEINSSPSKISDTERFLKSKLDLVNHIYIGDHGTKCHLYTDRLFTKAQEMVIQRLLTKFTLYFRILIPNKVQIGLFLSITDYCEMLLDISDSPEAKSLSWILLNGHDN